ncbi:hypothetical protein RchiOBHm_Chr7g0238351 [Rosa chinensis]|uniref:Uncharacterized protein n=1 Tax=Rosa chinensis TaxID=74649 RepID=A0A2P6PHF2_ROSCH|nr:hypothetical protein RchiOBHm_Chr7g0238351 [Rosa chinensis]
MARSICSLELEKACVCPQCSRRISRWWKSLFRLCFSQCWICGVLFVLESDISVIVVC